MAIAPAGGTPVSAPPAPDPLRTPRHLAAVVGPTLVVLALTEAAHLDVMLAAAGPERVGVVYLNGFVLFVAGLALVRAHGRWSLRWPVLLTMTGWAALLVGLLRMAFPVAAGQAVTAGPATYAVLIGLGLVGAVLSWQGWFPRGG
jgi:hypothetical protein